MHINPLQKRKICCMSQMNTPAEALLTPEDVAALLGVPISTLYQWNYRGSGPVARRIGRHLRYRRGDLEAWIDKQPTRNRD